MSSRLLAGRYELIEKVGDGGMAIVYRGKDRLLNRYVAIKILRPEYTKDEQFINSFKRESQAAAGLTHPNIVGIYDVGQEGNIHYIVMELIEGKALSEIIKEKGKLDYKEAMDITKQVASALSLAHKNQIVHRDVKPHNIMITNTGVAKLADFGIAKAVSSATIVGGKDKVMGSVHYFSPEQARASYVDERSDIYSLGIVLYEMLTGKVPFDGDNPVSIALLHINEPMPHVTDEVPGIPPQLERIILKATDKYQSNRFKSADEMIEALDSLDYISKVMGNKVFMGFEKDNDSVVEEYEKAVESGDSNSRKFERNTSFRHSERRNQDNDSSERYSEKASKERKSGKIKKASDKSKSGEGDFTDKLDEKTVRNMIIAAICIIIIGGVVILGAVQGWFSKEKDTIEVPSFIGMTIEEAIDAAEKIGLVVEKGDEVFSADQEEGKITSQNPVAESVVTEGKVITVNISLGKQDDRVPKLIGMKYQEAKTYLQSLGFELGTVKVVSGTEEKDTIIKQSIAEGGTAKKGTSIDVEVSDGKAKKTTEMPNLYGMTPQEADAALKKCGLERGSVTFEEVEDVKENLVFGQQYSYGTVLEEGTTVDYKVSKGAPEPDVTEPEPSEPSGSDTEPSEGGGSDNSDENSGNSDNNENTEPGLGDDLEEDID